MKVVQHGSLERTQFAPDFGVEGTRKGTAGRHDDDEVLVLWLRWCKYVVEEWEGVRLVSWIEDCERDIHTAQGSSARRSLPSRRRRVQVLSTSANATSLLVTDKGESLEPVRRETV